MVQRERFEEVLTGRQLEVTDLVSAGLSNKEIARSLDLSEGTVKIHLHKTSVRLGVANRTALAVMWRTSIHEPQYEPVEDRRVLPEATNGASGATGAELKNSSQECMPQLSFRCRSISGCVIARAISRHDPEDVRFYLPTEPRCHVDVAT
jgi:DNA-binding CsgD family transcriptional regulator